jgi:hypothetical protein
MQPQTHALIRYIGELFIAFVVVIFVAVFGSILGLTLFAIGGTSAAPCVCGSDFIVLHSGWLGSGVRRQSPPMLQGCPVDVDSAHDLVCVLGCQ